MLNGFVKVAAAIPSLRVGDTSYNVDEMIAMTRQAESQDVDIIVFPELGMTGYTCQDLFRSKLLLCKAEQALQQLVDATRLSTITVIVGMPIEAGNALLNTGVVVQQGHIVGIVPKTFLPNYSEFYEKRWFVSALEIKPTTVHLCGNDIMVTPEPQVFTASDGSVAFGVEICEDVWAPVPPSCNLAQSGADIIFNLSASDELIGKHQYLKGLLAQQSARTLSAYVYASCGYGESTQDVVYGGNAIIYENGTLLAESKRFEIQQQLVVEDIDVERLRAERKANTTFACGNSRGHALTVTIEPMGHGGQVTRRYDPRPFIPKSSDMAASCEEILSIQTMGLARRIDHTHAKCVVIGISGGLDSTLALLVAVRAFDKLGLSRKGIIGVTMPGFGTTDRTHDNAVNLMHSLGVSAREISISAAVTQHFKDIGHDMTVHDVTYENSQARERTQILMDVANKEGGLVVGTGDLSELALGWATYNGDHMSMYGVNASVPKTLIKHLVNYMAMNGVDEQSRNTLLDIIDTPISPELIPADEQGRITQKTEDLVGPYELHDFFLYYYLRFGFRPSRLFDMACRAFDGSCSEAGQYDEATIRHWLNVFFRRFFAQQFKRSCLPDGPKVGSVSLSPRGDWRMPTDASAALWLRECEEITLPNND